MAEVNMSAAKPPGRIRSKKMSTRIDFTPMVDLGFLLITFFMLTTTLSKPQVMALAMPDRDPIEPPELPESKMLTLLLGAGDKIYWYEGIREARLDSTDFGAGGLRRVILDKMGRVAEKWGPDNYRDAKTGQPRSGSHLNILIKPAPESRYQNLVDALDEMAICHVRYYMILDASGPEREFIKHPEKGLAFSPEQQQQAMLR